jgi:hypothetical protein
MKCIKCLIPSFYYFFHFFSVEIAKGMFLVHVLSELWSAASYIQLTDFTQNKQGVGGQRWLTIYLNIKNCVLTCHQFYVIKSQLLLNYVLSSVIYWLEVQWQKKYTLVIFEYTANGRKETILSLFYYCCSRGTLKRLLSYAV